MTADLLLQEASYDNKNAGPLLPIPSMRISDKNVECRTQSPSLHQGVEERRVKTVSWK
jgi:hypothetical protein